MRLLLTLLFFVPLIGFSQYWQQQGQDIDGEAAGDASGWSVSMNAAGDRVAIGAYGNDGNGSDAGHVRVYEWNGSLWVQQGQDIDGESALDYSGRSVSMNAGGDILAIGANSNDGNGYNAGHVRIYTWNGTSWTQQGQDIDGESASDFSGISVSMNPAGDRVAIGAPGNDGNVNNAGHVRIYEWSVTSWVQQGQDIDGEAAGDGSGESVSMNATGDIVAIGAAKNDGNGSNAGHVRVYSWNGSSWIQLGQDIDGEAAGDNSGESVSMNATGDRVAVGSWKNVGNGPMAGHVRIYAWNGTSWTQRGQDIDGSAYSGSGRSVSMNAFGDRLAIGAPSNGVGHVKVNNCACCTYSTDFITDCDSHTWLNGNTYTTSTNMPFYILPNSQGCDSIITLNLNINNSNTGIDSQTACNSYTWIDGNTYTSSTNTPTYTLINAAGCDSVLTLNLTLNTVNSSITNTTPTLTADATGATYQWLDCDNNYAPIPGETNQSFTATANGSYAVEVTQNGCVDTSACEQVNNVGINEINSSITLHPNPTTGLVELQGINGSFKVDVYDYAGKYLKSTSRSTIDLSEYPSGIYFLKVAYGDKTEELRVVKE